MIIIYYKNRNTRTTQLEKGQRDGISNTTNTIIMPSERSSYKHYVLSGYYACFMKPKVNKVRIHVDKVLNFLNDC
jgi:hypothetical protein